ncbi:MAG: hypothetical protein Q4B99_06350 [Clostridia bacterium]|nr:hypothetical protein [Clostridia bacterium]
MEWLYGYVTRICAMSALIMLMKMALPEGRIKSSAEKVMAVALLACIAEPLLLLMRGG